MSDRPGAPPSLPLTLAARVDRACDTFEAAWRAGGRPRIEDHLASAAEADRPALLLQLLASELEARRRLGERPEPGEYLGRFADHPGLVEAAFAGTGTVGDDPGPGTEVATAAFRRVDPGRSPLPAHALPGYEILGELGRGGMGVVYKARDLRLNRVVALKMLLAGAFSPEAVGRLLAEAEAIARIQDPRIVRVHGVGEHEGHPYFEMEYVAGGSLADRLDGRPRPARASAELVEGLARAIHEAHRRGIVHRDLKPANVLIAGDGSPRISDFGLAKFLGDDAGPAPPTRTGALLGTPGYMAPEQAEGRAGRAGPGVDVHALGVLLYELTTGRRPFPGPSLVEALDQVRTAVPVAPRDLVADLPRELEAICLKCLEKEPARRYLDARELAEDLARFLSGEPILARGSGPIERLAGALRRGGHDEEFRGWGDLVLAAIAPATLPHLLIFWAALADPDLIRPALIVPWLFFATLAAGFAWVNRSRVRLPQTPAVRHLAALTLGLVFTTTLAGPVGRAMGVVEGPVDELRLYALVALLNGQYFFGLGGSYWGGCYAIGAAFLLAAPVMGAHPIAAPPLTAALIAAGFLAIGLRLRRLGRDGAGSR